MNKVVNSTLTLTELAITLSVFNSGQFAVCIHDHTTSVAPIIGSAIGYRPIIAIVQYIGCLSDSTYRYSIYAVVYLYLHKLPNHMSSIHNVFCKN